MADNAVLARWANFPVDAADRPLLIAQPYVTWRGSGDGQSKLAARRGAIDDRVGLPLGVLDLLGVSATAAEPRLAITGAEVADRAVLTDRGARMLPCYLLQIESARGPVEVLDPDLDVWWPSSPRDDDFSGGAAVLEPDGATLHVHAFGGALTEFLGCEFDESPTAVVAYPMTRERAAKPGAIIPQYGVLKPVTGRLAQPLGNRVLLNAQGVPTVVAADWEHTHLPR